jgi:hypothetical protein
VWKFDRHGYKSWRSFTCIPVEMKHIAANSPKCTKICAVQSTCLGMRWCQDTAAVRGLLECGTGRRQGGVPCGTRRASYHVTPRRQVFLPECGRAPAYAAGPLLSSTSPCSTISISVRSPASTQHRRGINWCAQFIFRIPHLLFYPL